MKITGNSILSVWKDSLHHLVEATSIVPTERNLDTYEIENAVLTVQHPLENLDELLAFEKARGHDFGDSALVEYWKEVAQKLKKFPKSSVAQLDFIAEKLGKSPYNRHGYASIWSPAVDTVSLYPSCIIGIYFSIRNDCLNMTSILRSNDAWGQALNDMYELTMIQEKMAKRLQIKMGTYSHFAMSYHLYLKDYVNAMLYLKEE